MFRTNRRFFYLLNEGFPQGFCQDYGAFDSKDRDCRKIHWRYNSFHGLPSLIIPWDLSVLSPPLRQKSVIIFNTYPDLVSKNRTVVKATIRAGSGEANDGNGGMAAMSDFNIQAPFEPTGDQPKAIKQLTKFINGGNRYQTLLGATGTGKTHTIARVINEVGKPTLVLAHNKTLAAQLCNELREFFPDNAVEYFISYYDYYQPEAYIPVTDTYIAKTASINEEIDMLRHSATRSLFERKDVIVVASISCIYGLGIPSEYLKASIPLKVGMEVNQRQVLRDSGQHSVQPQ
jgi:hypothetical protein